MNDHGFKVVPIGPTQANQSGENRSDPEPARGQPGPRLMERVRTALRVRHYSANTETAYVSWILRYITFHGRRHPDQLGEAEISVFADNGTSSCSWATEVWRSRRPSRANTRTLAAR